MKQTVDYKDILKRLNEQLPKGVFLNVQHEGVKNVMTIGWALTGVMWGRAVMCVAVRPSRYTYTLIENIDRFTISVPKPMTLQNELNICGTRSGRDVDKYEQCGFGKKGIIDKCDLHIECSIVHKVKMDDSTVTDDITKRFYPKDDWHMLYFGEIIQCYYTKEE